MELYRRAHRKFNPPDRAPVGSKPVCRLSSDSLGRHFYSISESEKRKLVDQYTQVWTFEGVAWYAFDQASN